MKLRVVVLGAGFGGLELSTILAENLGDRLDLTLIDKNDSFFFGFSKFDVLFGHKSSQAVRLYYSRIVKPGVKFIRDIITSVDPVRKIVTTKNGIYEADVLVIALGADYDMAATPGLAEGGNEFYSFAGAERLRDVLPTFSKGKIIVGVCGAPFKCPPAPSEAALLIHDYLTKRGIRNECEIGLVMPFGLPIPPSPDTSKALLKAFAERKIKYISNHTVKAIDPSHKVAILDDGTKMSFELFLGIPKHRVPEVIEKSGMSLPAQAAAIMALKDENYYQSKYAETQHLRKNMKAMLLSIGICEVIEGVANFLLFYLPAGLSVKLFLHLCKDQNLFLRDVSNMGKSLGNDAIRIAVKDEKTNNKMMVIMKNAMDRLREIK